MALKDTGTKKISAALSPLYPARARKSSFIKSPMGSQARSMSNPTTIKDHFSVESGAGRVIAAWPDFVGYFGGQGHMLVR